jgi:hypothetical protein
MADELITREEDIEFGMVMEEGGVEDEYQPRIKNLGKIQRTKLTGFDRREPMVVYGLRDVTIHGTSSTGTPCSLIIFRWYLHQRQRNKRFKSLRISITFATQCKDRAGKIDGYYHPHVATVAPNGTFALMPTVVKNESKISTEASIDADFGGPSIGAKVGYELSRTYETNKQITINGTEYPNYGRHEQEDPDRCNAVEWNLFENDGSSSGLPTFFRTAVLLERRLGDKSNFTAAITTKAEVDNLVDAKTKMKDLFGFIPHDDPVLFDPSAKGDTSYKVFETKLDQVSIEDKCRFVMFRATSCPGNSTEADYKTSSSEKKDKTE